MAWRAGALFGLSYVHVLAGCALCIRAVSAVLGVGGAGGLCGHLVAAHAVPVQPDPAQLLVHGRAPRALEVQLLPAAAALGARAHAAHVGALRLAPGTPAPALLRPAAVVSALSALVARNNEYPVASLCPLSAGIPRGFRAFSEFCRSKIGRRLSERTPSQAAWGVLVRGVRVETLHHCNAMGA